MDCLDKIIKLSRTACECFGDEKPEDFDEGKTEIYLDELEGLNLSIMNAAADCENGGIWDMLVKARENATLAFQADLMSCLENNYVAKRPNYSGYLGKKDFTQTMNFSSEKAGQVIRFSNITGGKMVVRRIGLILNAAVTVTVNVYNNDENETTPIATYEILTVANTLTWADLETPLELSLWSNNVYTPRYYFVYTVNGFLPKNNKKQCITCDGGTKEVAYNNWISIAGIRGNGTDYDSFSTYDELMGMLLDVQLTCDGSRVICSDDYPLDFTSGKALQMAYAVRFKAGAILVDKILSSSQINRYTMMDREELYVKRNNYRSRYEQWIQYLCDNSIILNNDCWKCKPSNMLSRGTILK